MGERKKELAFLDLPFDYWLRVLIDFLTAFGRSMFTPFMLIYLKQEGGFATSVVTLLTAVPQVFQLFSTSWGGVLADRYGRKPIMIFSLGVSAAVILFMLSPNYLVVYASYVLFLIFSNIYRPAAMAMITELVPADRHREAFSILRMTANLGFALGPLVGSLFFFSYRPFVIWGTVLVYLLAVGVIFWLPETGKQRDTSVLAKMETPLAALFLVRQDHRLRWAVLTGLFILMAQLQLFTSFTIVVNDEFQDNGRTVAYLMLINTVGVVIGQYFVTYRTRDFSFFKLMGYAIVFSFVGWNLLITPLGDVRFYLLYGFVTIAEMLMAAGYSTYIASLAPEGDMAKYMSFTHTPNIVAIMIGPIIGAFGYDWEGQLGYVISLWILLIVAFLSLRVLKRKEIEHGQPGK